MRDQIGLPPGEFNLPPGVSVRDIEDEPEPQEVDCCEFWPNCDCREREIAEGKREREEWR